MTWSGRIEGEWFDVPSHMANEAAKEAANALLLCSGGEKSHAQAAGTLLESSGCENEGSGTESTKLQCASAKGGAMIGASDCLLMCFDDSDVKLLRGAASCEAEGRCACEAEGQRKTGV